MVKHTHGAQPGAARRQKVGQQGDGAGNSEHTALLIEALNADPQKAEYYRSLLKPLQRYDNEHHGDLVSTLDVYLRHGGNATRTADALYLHRNSLRYRLARIQALTGLDPDDPDARLALQVGILLISKNQKSTEG